MVLVLCLPILRRDGDAEQSIAAAGAQVFPVDPAGSAGNGLGGEGDGFHLIGHGHGVGKDIRVEGWLKLAVVRGKGQQPGVAAGRLQHLEGQGDVHVLGDSGGLWGGELKGGGEHRGQAWDGAFQDAEAVDNGVLRRQIGPAGRGGVHRGHLARGVLGGDGPRLDAFPVGGAQVLQHGGVVLHLGAESRHLPQRAVVGEGDLHHAAGAALLHGEGRGKPGGLGSRAPQGEKQRPAQQGKSESQGFHGNPFFLGGRRSVPPSGTAVLRQRIPHPRGKAAAGLCSHYSTKAIHKIEKSPCFPRFFAANRGFSLFFTGGQLTERGGSFTIRNGKKSPGPWRPRRRNP